MSETKEPTESKAKAKTKGPDLKHKEKVSKLRESMKMDSMTKYVKVKATKDSKHFNKGDEFVIGRLHAIELVAKDLVDIIDEQHGDSKSLEKKGKKK